MLSETEYTIAAASVPCDVPAVKAVEAVESNGNGFLPDGRAKILFEAHIFGSITKHQYDARYPDISAPNWDEGRKHYVGGAGEYLRLARAVMLDRIAAMESASWGAYQVMGFNWRPLHYASVQQFVDSMSTDMGQLQAFLRYVQVNHLAQYMTDLDSMDSCRHFAEGYNGSGAVDVYASKIHEAYEHFLNGGTSSPHFRTLSIGMHGDDVKELQSRLAASTTPKLVADGDFGPNTHRAVQAFQQAHGLVVDGVVGHMTRAALGLPE